MQPYAYIEKLNLIDNNLQYGRTPSKLLTLCDADGEEFTVCHALNLVFFRHNDSRDLNIALPKAAGFNVCTNEPRAKEAAIHGEGGLQVDWCARGSSEHHIEVLFDCRILNADIFSYANKPLNNTLNPIHLK